MQFVYITYVILLCLVASTDANLYERLKDWLYTEDISKVENGI